MTRARLSGLLVPVILAIGSGVVPAQQVRAPAARSAAATQHSGKTPPAIPPIIDRELLFGDPEITAAQISPDGRYIAFVKPFKGTRNIWVKRTADPFEQARPLTADTRPILSYFWSRDGKSILWVQDQGGDENFNVYAVNPAEQSPADRDVPVPRNLTNTKGVRTRIYAVPNSDVDAIYVGLNDRDKAWHDVYKLRISTGERSLVLKNTDRFMNIVLDPNGELRLVTRAAENGDIEVLRVDPGSKFTKIYSCSVFETCGPVRFHKDGRRVYLETNKGEDADLIRLELLDVATGKEELVESDPLKRVDIGDLTFSEKTGELLASTYVDDKARFYFKDKAFQADYKLLKKRLPTSEIMFGTLQQGRLVGSSTTDDRLFLVSTSSDIEPGETYLFDRQSKKLTLQYRVRERLNRAWLAPMKPIRYRSSDGLEIPAYLTLPKGVPPKNLPLVVVPHGGPGSRDFWRYNTFGQFLANRGYAVLMPEFRGSLGYGRKFLDAGNKQMGDKMQDDVTWGVKYLIAEGIADPRRVGIMGGSFGGYVALAGVAFTPDVYAAAVSICGISSLVTQGDRSGARGKALAVRIGDISTPEGRSQLERQSPLNSAARIRTPLMLIHGANDPRVKKSQSDQIVVALRDRGFPVEYIVAPDEGHGFVRPVNNMAAYAAAEKFLAKFLGGRYQESMPPEVAARLKEITVDPKTLIIPPPATAPATAPQR